MLLGGAIAKGLLPFGRQLLRHHVLNRQMVTRRRLLAMLRLHQGAENRKGGTSRGAAVGPSIADPVPDRVVVGYPDTRVPESPDPSNPVLREVVARTGTATVGELRHGLV